MILKNEEYAVHGWKYDDGHDYHFVFTDEHEEPSQAELARRYGSIARGWRLISNWSLEDVPEVGEEMVDNDGDTWVRVE